MASIKQRLQKDLNLPETSFNNHCSDLYVLKTPEVTKWLNENYEYMCNVVDSYSNVEDQPWYGKRFYDIPFAFQEYRK